MPPHRRPIQEPDILTALAAEVALLRQKLFKMRIRRDNQMPPLENLSDDNPFAGLHANNDANRVLVPPQHHGANKDPSLGIGF